MKRHLGLDVLRGLAVLFVLLAHLPDGSTSRFVMMCQRTGWIGVDLFFVLSGFLVSGLLFREHQRYGALRVGRFLWRRGLKIYPAYYFYLGFTLLWCVWIGRDFTWISVGIHAVYLQNYAFLFGASTNDLWGHTWTLAVEEHFYLLLSGVMLLLARRSGPNPFRPVPWICLGLSVSCLGLRIASMRWLPHSYATHYSPTHLRIDSLTTGVALSYLLHYHREPVTAFLRRWTFVLVPVGVGLFLGMPLAYELHTTRWMWTFGFTGIAVGAACLVGTTVVREWPRIAPVRLLARIGLDSYSIYLWHPFVIVQQGLIAFLHLRLGVPTGDLLYASYCVVYVVLCVALGMVMSRMVEAPVLRIRDRLWPSRSGDGVVPEPTDREEAARLESTPEIVPVPLAKRPVERVP